MIKHYRSDAAILHALHQENPRMSLKTAEKSIQQVRAQIRSDYPTNPADIISVHSVRYGAHINQLLKTEELPYAQVLSGKISHQEWQASRKNKMRAYSTALDSMAQMENLLQIGNEPFQIDINENVDINLDEKKPKYDFSKLTFPEQVELMELIGLCRKDHHEPEGVQIINSEHEEITNLETTVINSAVNIDLIQLEPPAVTVDHVIKDPSAKLKENLFRIAAQRFKEIGGNLDDTEKKYLS
ncbi:hypothetical protein [Flavitalea sp.]|nr:hypothetical protein [Flavitalea sp.]